MDAAGADARAVNNVAELMRAEECDTRDELAEWVNEYTDDDGWIDWEQSDDRMLMVCVGRRGIGLEYPFTVEEFWDTVDELDDLPPLED